MAEIIFTRMDYGPTKGVMRRYGELTFWATAKECWLEGFMKISGAQHGDKEIIAIINAMLGAWEDCRKQGGGGVSTDDVVGVPLQRARGRHPKLGEVAGYKGGGLRVRVTAAATVLEADPGVRVPIANEDHLKSLRASLNKILDDRIEIRGDKPTSTEPTPETTEAAP